MIYSIQLRTKRQNRKSENEHAINGLHIYQEVSTIQHGEIHPIPEENPGFAEAIIQQDKDEAPIIQKAMFEL